MSFVIVPRHAAMCLLLALGATAAAQDRRPCLGQVVDAAGAPVQGAAVVAVWSSPVDPSFLHDEQHAVSDARGRFRLPLWNAVPYAVWAIGPAAAGTRPQVSALVRGACGGGLLDPLPLAAPDGDALRLEGLDAWRVHGATTLTLHCSALHFEGLPLVMPAEGETTVALPPRPRHCCALVVRDASGAPLAAAVVERGDAPTVVLPPPVEHTFRTDLVVGQHAGVRAQVALLLPQRWFETGFVAPERRWLLREVGPLAADGSFRVWLPDARDDDTGDYWQSMHVRVCDAGGPLATREVPGTRDEVDVLPAVEKLTLETGLVPCAAPPAADAQERLLVLPVRGEGTSWWFQPPFGVATRAQLAGGRHLDAAWACFELWRRAGEGVVGPPWQCLGALQPGGVASSTEQLSGNGVRTTLRVIDREGGPGRRAFVCIARHGVPGGADERHWLHTDQGGRVELRLAPGSYGVFACDGSSFGEAKVESVGGDAVGQRAMTVTLSALPTLRCRVLDVAGAPSPGARVHSMMHVPWPVLPDAEQKLGLAVKQMLQYRLLVQRVTDAEGRIELPVLTLHAGDEGGPQFAFQRVDGSSTGQVELVPREQSFDVK